jgi:hypothetical protein
VAARLFAAPRVVAETGYVNQRRVLARRAALGELLDAEPPPVGVIVAGGC